MNGNKEYLLANEISKRIFEKQESMNRKLSRSEIESIAYQCTYEWQKRFVLEPYNHDAMKELIKNNPFLQYTYDTSYKNFKTDDECFKEIHSSLIEPLYEDYNELYQEELDKEELSQEDELEL